MSQDALDSKIRKWNSLQGRRFGSSRKTVVDAGKQQLPPEALRRIIKDHGDMRWVLASSAAEQEQLSYQRNPACPSCLLES